METNDVITPTDSVVEGGSVGLQFKLTREKMGLSIADVRSRLKMTTKQVQALEDGDINALPPGSYGRAFAKSYAKFLGMDQDAVLLALFGPLESTQKTDFPIPKNDTSSGKGLNISMAEPKSKPPVDKGLATYSSNNKNTDKRMVYAAVAVLVLGVSVYLFGPAVQNMISRSPEPALEVSPGMPPATSEQPTEQTVTNEQGADKSVIVLPGAEKTEVVPAALPSPVTNVAPAPTTPVAVPVPAAPANIPAAAPTSAPVVAPANNSVTQPVATPAKPAAEAKPAAAKVSALKLTFTDRVWATVKDKDGKELFSQLNDPGTQKVIEGNGPFKLVLGNATAVKVEFGGKEVDIKPFIKNDVAKLTVE